MEWQLDITLSRPPRDAVRSYAQCDHHSGFSRSPGHCLATASPSCRHVQGKIHRVGPKFTSWPRSLAGSPYKSLFKELAQVMCQPCEFQGR
jgi:hypothetical protein